MDIIAGIRRRIRDFAHKLKYPREDFGKIGLHCKIGYDCTLVPKNMFLDDYVVIQNRVNFVSSDGKLIVKKYSVISTECIIIPGTHLAAPGIPFYFQTIAHYGDESSSIEIDEDCWVGAACVLLQKAKLGRGCVVAAGSVVTKPFPPYAVIAGVPAKIIGVKFSKEDLMRHEAAIYPPHERLTEQQVDQLFAHHYAGLKPMKKCDMAEVERFNAAAAIRNYSNA